jgi:hypothetical protein
LACAAGIATLYWRKSAVFIVWVFEPCHGTDARH